MNERLKTRELRTYSREALQQVSADQLLPNLHVGGCHLPKTGGTVQEGVTEPLFRVARILKAAVRWNEALLSQQLLVVRDVEEYQQGFLKVLVQIVVQVAELTQRFLNHARPQGKLY